MKKMKELTKDDIEKILEDMYIKKRNELNEIYDELKTFKCVKDSRFFKIESENGYIYTWSADIVRCKIDIIK